MSDFWFNFQLGIEHILDPNGYDHILFVIALCAVYTLREWKKVAWLVTAFTLGHSLTLALATFQIINIPSTIIEFLIPITIVFTCIANVFSIILISITNFFNQEQIKTANTKQLNFRYFLIIFFSLIRYFLAAIFGLIHGLGFSNFLKSILPRDVTIWKPLLAFNLGLEVGQLVIVGTFLLTAYLVINILKVQRRDWILVISSVIIGVALTIIQKNWIF